MSITLRGDPEEEAEARKHWFDDTDEGRAEQREAWKKWRAEYAASSPWHGRGMTIAERRAMYEGVLNAGRCGWDYGPIYVAANSMEFKDAMPPSYTDTQVRRDEDAERVEYVRAKRFE